VECTETLNHPIISFRIPALIDDGKERPSIQGEKGKTTLTHRGYKFTLELQPDSPGVFEPQPLETINHMGKIQLLEAPLINMPHDLSWIIKME
jgi:hypothetical protein